jgi:hypothetical protein
VEDVNTRQAIAGDMRGDHVGLLGLVDERDAMARQHRGTVHE